MEHESVRDFSRVQIKVVIAVLFSWLLILNISFIFDINTRQIAKCLYVMLMNVFVFLILHNLLKCDSFNVDLSLLLYRENVAVCVVKILYKYLYMIT